MQLALYGSIAWRHPLGVGQVIRWARRFGWPLVDLRGLSLDAPGAEEKRTLPWGYDMLGPRHVRPSAREQLRREIAEAGLELLCLYCPVPINLPGEFGRRCRQLAQDYLLLAAQLGARWLRPINNTCWRPEKPPMSPQEAFDRTVEGLRELAPLAAQHQVGLLLENNENTVTSCAEELLQMQQALAGACRVGLCLDGANAYFQERDPSEEIRTLGGQIDVIHVKNVRRHEQGRWDYMPRGRFSYQWTSLAQGDLDWSALLAQAQAQGFDGPVVYEYVNPFKGMPLRYWDSLPEPEQAAAQEGAYLRQVIKSLPGREGAAPGGSSSSPK